MAEGSEVTKQVEAQRATVVAWFNQGPGGILAAVFVLVLVVLLILTAAGLLYL